MMKREISRNDLHGNIYSVGYCKLQSLLRCESAYAYNAGIYGWNWDAYRFPFENITIVTGYRNLTGKKIPHEISERYENIARNIDKIVTNYNESRKRKYELILNMIKEVDNDGGVK